MLVRRGQGPDRGSWAPPGGYVESHESAERAAIRETWEETGLKLRHEDLIPFGVFSRPHITQVYVSFLVKLPRIVPLSPRPPETTAVDWFTEADFPSDEIWTPAVDFNIPRIYERFRSERFDFYQRTDHFMRCVSDGTEMTTIWRQDDNDGQEGADGKGEAV